MFTVLRTVFISLAVLLFAACGTLQAGRDFDLRVFESRVERGVTTQSQVRAWLGAPASTGISVSADGERYDEWTYYFAEGNLTGMSAARVKILQVKFDRQGIVRGYNWSDSGQ